MLASHCWGSPPWSTAPAKLGLLFHFFWSNRNGCSDFPSQTRTQSSEIPCSTFPVHPASPRGCPGFAVPHSSSGKEFFFCSSVRPEHKAGNELLGPLGQPCRASEQQAQVKGIKELVALLLCTGVDILNHIWCWISLEGKEEGRREGKNCSKFPLSTASSSRICAQYSPSLPGLSHWHHLPPTELDELSGIIFSPYFGESPAGAAVSSSSPLSLTPAPIRRAENSKWKLLFPS